MIHNLQGLRGLRNLQKREEDSFGGGARGV